MTVIDQSPEEKMDLEIIHDEILKAIETDKFPQARELLQTGTQFAQDNNLNEWTEKFDELRQQLDVILHIDELDDETDIIDSVTKAQNFMVIKGVGPSTAQKLTNAGFLTITQIAQSTPQEISVIKGFSLPSATKLIENANNYLQTQIQHSVQKHPKTIVSETITSAQNSLDTPLQSRVIKETNEPVDISHHKSLELSSSLENVEKVDITQNDDWNETENSDDLEEKGELNKQNLYIDAKVRYSHYFRNTDIPSCNVEQKPQNILQNRQTITHENFDELEELEEEIYEKTSSKIKMTSSMPPKIISTQSTPQLSLIKEIERILKKQQYHLIPNHHFYELTYLAYKILTPNDHVKLFLLIPIRIEENAISLIVSEDSITSQGLSTAEKSKLVLDFLDCRDMLRNDLTTEGDFFQFLNGYLKLNLTVQKSIEQKYLYLTSGQDQYNILIEPILITKSRPYFIEKSIPFAYQRNTNLHIIQGEHLVEILKFMESKYTILETHVHRKTAVQRYFEASAKFNYRLRINSYLVLGYAIILGIMWGTQWFYLLRVFLNIGYAVIGMFFLSMFYIYYRFYIVKKELATEFITPYYQKDIQFEEADLLLLKEEYPEKVMLQFGYECFGKTTKYNILNNLELFSKPALSEVKKKNAIPTQQQSTIPIQESKNGFTDKYRSFLEE